MAERWFNFPLEMLTPEGVRYRPTKVVMPAWMTPTAQEEGERNHGISGMVTRWISREFNLARLDLLKSPLFRWLPLALDSAELLPHIKARIPTDAVEIVDWMQESAAHQAMLSARVAEYNRHSLVVARATDAYIPGVRAEDVFVQRITGARLLSTRVFNVSTPIGLFSVPDGEGRTFIGSSLLAWAAGEGLAGYQWTAQVVKWVDLARTPITRGVGFIQAGPVLAPNFFVQEPNREASRVRVRVRVASPTDQTLHFTFRSPTDYRTVIDETDVPVGRGETDIEYVVASYPSVPVAVLQMQPAAGAVLREYRAEAE